MVAGRHVRIGVALAAQFALEDIVGKAAKQLAGIRRAIADRIVKRVFQRITLMRESRRNIENIARLHLFIDDRLEGVNLQQVRMRAVLFHRHLFPNAPAPTAGALNDKHIILIQMRADAASRHREGDHQVVDTPVRQSTERMHQRCGRFMPVVNRLHQQGPVVFAQVIVAFEGTVTDLPFSILMADKAAIDLALHGQSCQFVRA